MNRRKSVFIRATFRFRFFLLILSLSSVLGSGPAFAKGPVHLGKDLLTVIGTAEELFRAMEEGDLPGIWLRLTGNSRATIVRETIAAYRKAGEEGMDEAALWADFEAGGEVAREYWGGFLRSFDPRKALEESLWELAGIEGGQAEIRITHRDSERPALLKLFWEDGSWKVGLVESFWGRVAR